MSSAIRIRESWNRRAEITENAAATASSINSQPRNTNDSCCCVCVCAALRLSLILCVLAFDFFWRWFGNGGEMQQSCSPLVLLLRIWLLFSFVLCARDSCYIGRILLQPLQLPDSVENQFSWASDFVSVFLNAVLPFAFMYLVAGLSWQVVQNSCPASFSSPDPIIRSLYLFSRAVCLFSWVQLAILCRMQDAIMNSIVSSNTQMSLRETIRSRMRVLTCHLCWGGSDDADNEVFRTIALQIEHMVADSLQLSMREVLSGMVLAEALLHRQQTVLGPDQTHNSATLSVEDMDTLQFAEHVSFYAVAAYGWPLYILSGGIRSTCRLLYSVIRRPFLPSTNMRIYGAGFLQLSLRAFIEQTQCNVSDVVCANLQNHIQRLVYYVCRDKKTQSLVVAIRGTLSIPDLCTDAHAWPASLHRYGYPGHHVHSGVLQSALRLRDELRGENSIQQFLSDNADYRTCFVGHSIGGGVAILLSLIMDEDFPRCRSVAFGPPPLFDKRLANSAHFRNKVVCIVNSDDIVPRLSIGNLIRLKTRVIQAIDICSDTVPNWRVLANAFRFRSDLFDDLSRQELFEARQELIERQVELEEKCHSPTRSRRGSEVNDLTPGIVRVPLFSRLSHTGKIFYLSRDPVTATSTWDLSFLPCAGMTRHVSASLIQSESLHDIILSRNMWADHSPYAYHTLLQRFHSDQYHLSEHELQDIALSESDPLLQI